MASIEELETARREQEASGERVRAIACTLVRERSLSEVKAAQVAGVSRETLRRWLGK